MGYVSQCDLSVTFFHKQLSPAPPVGLRPPTAGLSARPLGALHSRKREHVCFELAMISKDCPFDSEQICFFFLFNYAANFTYQYNCVSIEQMIEPWTVTTLPAVHTCHAPGRRW